MSSRALVSWLSLLSSLLALACAPPSSPGDDAGSRDKDAGIPVSDDDGGTPAPHDAGLPPSDAGTSDAGTPDAPGDDAGPQIGCPADDIYEDNDERAAATLLSSGETIAGWGCGDDDWYAIEAEAGCSVDARIELDPSTGDLDLALFGPSGQLLDVANGLSVLSVVQSTATGAGAYAVRVRGPSSARTPYRLTMTKVCASELSCPADDPYEDNDELFAARAISEDVQLRGIVCPDDPDYYRVPASPGCVLDVRLGFTDDDGDLDLRLYRADGTVSSRSAGVSNEERVIDTVPAEGAQAIEVYGHASAENTYALRVGVTCPNEMSCPADDPFAPNHARTEAFRLEKNDEATGITCGADDWYRFSVSTGCTVDLALRFAHADGDLDVQLRDANDTILARGNSSDDDEELSYTAASAGTLYARVYGFQSAQNRYRLELSQTCPE